MTLKAAAMIAAAAIAMSDFSMMSPVAGMAL